MAINWMGLVTSMAVFTGIIIGLFIVIFLFKCKPGEDINRWEQWQQWLSNRRTPAGHGWSQFAPRHGAVELQHGNGTGNGTTHATADDTADDNADDAADGTADDTAGDTLDGTATGAAIGTVAGTSDTSADATANVAANGAASGPH